MPGTVREGRAIAAYCCRPCLAGFSFNFLNVSGEGLASARQAVGIREVIVMPGRVFLEAEIAVIPPASVGTWEVAFVACLGPQPGHNLISGARGLGNNATRTESRASSGSPSLA